MYTMDMFLVYLFNESGDYYSLLVMPDNMENVEMHPVLIAHDVVNVVLYAVMVMNLNHFHRIQIYFILYVVVVMDLRHLLNVQDVGMVLVVNVVNMQAVAMHY